MRLALALGAALSALTTQAPQLPPAIVERDTRQAELAAEAAARGPAIPVPLLGDGNRPLGAVYDQYFLGVVIGRALVAEGKTPDARAIQAHPLWQSRGTVVVAYPIDCDGRPNQPLAIRWVNRMNVPVSPTVIAGPARGTEARSILPGVGLPDDALVVQLRNAIPAGTSSVEVDYANSYCRGAAKTASFSITTAISALGRGINNMKLPPNLATLPSPSTVRISLTQDAAGRVRFAEQTQGPVELGPIAIAELTSRTFQPSLTNGVPAPMNLGVAVVFTTDGTPTNPAPFVPPAAIGPGMMTTSTLAASPSAPSGPLTPVPPAPAGLLDSQMARIAVEVAAKSDPVAVPLDAAGPVVHGVLFDRFLLAVVKARAAFKSGAPMDPAAAESALLQNGTLVVAYPLSCGTASIAPVDIRLSMGGARPGPVRETTDTLLTGLSLADRLPGFALPAGAAGRSFAGAGFSQNLEVRVTYASACGSTGSSLAFPIQWVRGISAPRMTTTKLPASSTLPSPTTVQLRGMVDLNGISSFPDTCRRSARAWSDRGGDGVTVEVRTVPRERRAHPAERAHVPDVHDERDARADAAAGRRGTTALGYRGRCSASDDVVDRRRSIDDGLHDA